MSFQKRNPGRSDNQSPPTPKAARALPLRSRLLLELLEDRLAPAVVGFEDFDGGAVNLLSTTNVFDYQGGTLISGADGGSSGDVFGRVDGRSGGTGMPFDVADDTVADVSGARTGSAFPADTLGLAGQNTSAFFALNDMDGSGVNGNTNATWRFDISRASSLTNIQIDIGAIGDFEASSSDGFTIEARIDSGTFQTIFDATTDESASKTYRALDDGSTPTLDDPLQLFIDGSSTAVGYLDKSDPTTGDFDAYISTLLAGQSGSTLDIRISWDGTPSGGEPMGIDNIVIQGDVSIDVLDFEDGTGVGYSTSVTEFTDGSGDFWLRTDGSDFGSFVSYTGQQGTYYFAGMDLDGEGATLPLTLTVDSIDITGLSNLNFSVLLAEDDDGSNEDWDLPDYVHFDYQIDGGGFQPLLWIESVPDGDDFNAVPAIDTDFDGDGDGTEITNTFTEFFANISGTGSTLDIRIEWNLDSGDEDLAIDNLIVFESSVNQAPTAQDDSFSTPVDVPITGDLFANNGNGADFDPENDSFTITQVNGQTTLVGSSFTLSGTGATVTVSSDGSFSYDPTAGSPGTDTFTYTIDDGNGASSATVTINTGPALYHELASGPFMQDWSDTSLITTDDDWSGVPSIIGYRGDGLTGSTGTNPQSITGASTVVDVNANETNPDTFFSGGVAEFELTDPTIAINGSGTADAPYIQLHLDTTGVSKAQISYNLQDLDGSGDDSTQQVALQYRVGNTGTFTDIPAGYVSDATTGPNLATQVTSVTAELPSAAMGQSQVQVRIMTSNAAGNDEWVGVDDIVVEQLGVNVSLVGNDLTIEDLVGQNDDLTISVNGSNLVIDDANGILTGGTPNSTGSGNQMIVPLSDFTGGIIVNTEDGSDTLTLDFSGGTFGAEVNYDGGDPTTGPGDQLIVSGGAFTDGVMTFTGPDSGDLTLDTQVITYTGLEPVLIDVGSIENMVFELPAGTTDAVLENDTTMTGNSQLLSPSDNFEVTSFTNPTMSLTIRGGEGADTIALAGLDTAFNADLEIDDSLGTDAVTVRVAGTTNVGSGSVDIAVDEIDFITGSLMTSGNVNLNAETGDITDSNSGTDVVAAGLSLQAATGIGTDADAIDTQVSVLAAHTDSGDIHVTNTGAVTVGTVGGVTGIEITTNTNPGVDNITITAASPTT